MPLSKGPAAKFVRPISFVFVFGFKFKFLLYLYAAASNKHGVNIPLSKGPPAMLIIPRYPWIVHIIIGKTHNPMIFGTAHNFTTLNLPLH